MKGSKRLIYGFFLIELVFFLLVMILLQRADLSRFLSGNIYVLDENVSLIRGGHTSTENLNTYHFGEVDRGEIFVLKTTLPASDVKSPALMFKTMQSTVTLNLDGQTIYTDGQLRYQEKKMLSRKYHVVYLPDDTAGRELTLTLTVTENGAFYNFDPVYFGSAYDLFLLNLLMRRIPLFAGVFMLLFGLAQLAFVPYMYRKGEDDAPRVGFTALFNLMMGLFLLSNNLLLQLLTGSDVLNTHIEFISIYANLIAVSGFLMTSLDNRRFRGVFKLLFLINLLLVVTALLLHFTNTIHLSQLLLPYYILTLLETIPFLVYIVRGFLPNHGLQRAFSDDLLAERILFMGFFVFLVCCVLHVGGILYTRFLSQNATSTDIQVMTYGCLVFCGAMVLNYFLSTITQSGVENERSHLVNLAYSDPMTGLSNRARCAQVMDVLSRGVDPFAIFSLDMDHLKHVNDTLGHVEGDRLIRGFSDILKESFWDAILVGRMGGDEFVVITGDSTEAAIGRRMQAMRLIMDAANRKETRFEYSVSYGYAFSSESASGWAHEVYTLADQRMYEMKRKRHESADNPHSGEEEAHE